MRQQFSAGPDDDDRRIESVLRRLLPHQSLSNLHRGLRKGDIRLNGAKVAPQDRVRSGDQISVWQALLEPTVHTGGGIQTRLNTEWILYEDSHFLVINKPSGLLVHRGDAQSSRSTDDPLDELVRTYLQPKLPPSLSFRPGPLHRLDRETSGIIVFSASLVGARDFSLALGEHRVKKTYLAVVMGQMERPQKSTRSLMRDEGTRTTSTSETGMAAYTEFRPLSTFSGFTLVEVTLGTGRTHQIRAHAADLGHPLAGDRKYGGTQLPPGLSAPWLLHAWKLESELLPPLEAPLNSTAQQFLNKTFKFRY